MGQASLQQDGTPTNCRAYTVKAFCAAYGVSRTTFYAEVGAGRLRTYYVGRCRFVSVAAADAWQSALEAEAISAAGPAR